MNARPKTRSDSEATRRGPSRASASIRWTVLAVALLGLWLPATSLAAGDDDPFDRPGFYLGLGGSYQYNVFESQIEDVIVDALKDEGSLPPGTNVGIDLQDSGGVNAVVGYRVWSWFALEIEYEWVDQYEINGSTSIPGVAGNLYSIEGHTLTANTKWIIPFWRIQPYLSLGGGLSISKVDRGNVYDNPILGPVLESAGVDPKSGKNTTAAGRAGLGLDLYVTENILLNAEVSAVLTTLSSPDLNDIDDLNYMSFAAGLQYRF